MARCRNGCMSARATLTPADERAAAPVASSCKGNRNRSGLGQSSPRRIAGGGLGVATVLRGTDQGPVGHLPGYGYVPHRQGKRCASMVMLDSRIPGPHQAKVGPRRRHRRGHKQIRHFFGLRGAIGTPNRLKRQEASRRGERHPRIEDRCAVGDLPGSAFDDARIYSRCYLLRSAHPVARFRRRNACSTAEDNSLLAGDVD